MVIDVSTLKTYLMDQRDNDLNKTGKYNHAYETYKKILLKMNAMDNTVVTAEDLICEGVATTYVE